MNCTLTDSQILALIGSIFIIGLLAVVFGVFGATLLKERRSLKTSKTAQISRPAETMTPEDFSEMVKRREFEALPEEARKHVYWRNVPKRLTEEVLQQFRDQYAKSAKVKAHYLDQEYQDKMKAIDADRVQVLLDELSDLGSKLRMFDVSLNMDEPRVVERIWPETREYMVLSMAINELGGEFSVAKLEGAFRAYNDQCEQSGQRKLRITQRFIRDVGEKYTSNARTGPIEELRPFRVIPEDFGPGETYVLLYVDGNRRRVVSIDKMAGSVNAT